MAEFSCSQKQETWFKVSHVEEDLLTWATQANKQAGGVAKTSLDNKAKEMTEENRVLARMIIYNE